jgi:putative DNA primase/helicase
MSYEDFADKLSPEHYRMLAVESAISDEMICARDYHTEQVKARLAELGFGRRQHMTPSLVIPLYKPNGQHGLYQIRPDTPRIGPNGKPLKYEFPCRAHVCLDVPPLPWVFDALKNPAVPLLFTEGTKKADAAASQGLACVAAIGVWNWRGTNKHGGKMTLPDLDDIAWNGRDVFLVYDSDVMVKEPVHTALARLAGVLQNRDAHVQYIYLPSGPHGEKVGLDDWFAHGHTKEALFTLAQPTLQPTNGHSARGGDNDTDQAEALAQQLQAQYAYNATMGDWMEYGTEVLGVWSRLDQDLMYGVVARALKVLLGKGQSMAKIRAVEVLMRHHCLQPFDHAPVSLLPMANGVFDLDTRQLLDHDPHDGFTWALPYAYDPNAACPGTQAWLREAMQGDDQLVEVLRAYLRAIVLGRAERQVFLEVYGPGGSGKGTYTRLAQALVGPQNTKATTFNRLATSRFETTAFYDKRLALITEAEAYARGIELLKALTGGDAIPYERKGHDAQADFVFGGMVIISGNQRFSSLDNTSGLGRRRLTVSFGYQPRTRRQLLEFQGTQPIGDLADELPGVLNWVLDMDEKRMRRLLSPYGRGEKRLAQERLHSLVETNTIAAWAEECVVYDPAAATRVGKFIKPDRYNDAEVSAGEDQHLYPNYRRYCVQSGREKPKAQNTFSRDLMDLATVQLGYSGVGKETDPHTEVACMRGIRLRRPADTGMPRFVTGAGGDAEPTCFRQEIVVSWGCHRIKREVWSPYPEAWEPADGARVTCVNEDVCEWVNGQWELIEDPWERPPEGETDYRDEDHAYVWRKGRWELVWSSDQHAVQAS